MSLLSKMNAAPRHPDITDALDVYVTALKARDKAEETFRKADEVAQQRAAELEATIDRVTAELDPEAVRMLAEDSRSEQ
jgi:predicted NBD/HSP70 family sugar kinase